MGSPWSEQEPLCIWPGHRCSRVEKFPVNPLVYARGLLWFLHDPRLNPMNGAVVGDPARYRVTGFFASFRRGAGGGRVSRDRRWHGRELTSPDVGRVLKLRTRRRRCHHPLLPIAGRDRTDGNGWYGFPSSSTVLRQKNSQPRLPSGACRCCCSPRVQYVDWLGPAFWWLTVTLLMP